MNDGGPAFPATVEEYSGGLSTKEVHYPGMSLRDWLAGMAMQGLIVSVWKETGADYTANSCAKEAYQFADAMLAEKEKGRVS
jgi:hypothetical protein